VEEAAEQQKGRKEQKEENLGLGLEVNSGYWIMWWKRPLLSSLLCKMYESWKTISRL
jgi:hypothetical protein